MPLLQADMILCVALVFITIIYLFSLHNLSKKLKKSEELALDWQKEARIKESDIEDLKRINDTKETQIGFYMEATRKLKIENDGFKTAKLAEERSKAYPIPVPDATKAETPKKKRERKPKTT